jgi:hypothetical protein
MAPSNHHGAHLSSTRLGLRLTLWSQLKVRPERPQPRAPTLQYCHISPDVHPRAGQLFPTTSRKRSSSTTLLSSPRRCSSGRGTSGSVIRCEGLRRYGKTRTTTRDWTTTVRRRHDYPWRATSGACTSMGVRCPIGLLDVSIRSLMST